MGSPRQVLWLLWGYGLAASRCGHPWPSSFPPQVGGTTQGAFSCGGEKPSSHLCTAPGCTSVRALKNPEAVGWFSPSGGQPGCSGSIAVGSFAVGPCEQQQREVLGWLCCWSSSQSAG